MPNGLMNAKTTNGREDICPTVIRRSDWPFHLSRSLAGFCHILEYFFRALKPGYLELPEFKNSTKINEFRRQKSGKRSEWRRLNDYLYHFPYVNWSSSFTGDVRIIRFLGLRETRRNFSYLQQRAWMAAENDGCRKMKWSFQTCSHSARR